MAWEWLLGIVWICSYLIRPFSFLSFILSARIHSFELSTWRRFSVGTIFCNQSHSRTQLISTDIKCFVQQSALKSFKWSCQHCYIGCFAGCFKLNLFFGDSLLNFLWKLQVIWYRISYRNNLVGDKELCLLFFFLEVNKTQKFNDNVNTSSNSKQQVKVK